MVGAVKVLVVEDDADVRMTLVDLLEVYGYAVCAADCAEAALEALSRESFAVVLTDYNLPGLNGTELLIEAGRRGQLGASRAALITAHPDPRRLPGVPVIPKPLDVDAFLVTLEALASGAQARAA